MSIIYKNIAILAFVYIGGSTIIFFIGWFLYKNFYRWNLQRFYGSRKHLIIFVSFLASTYILGIGYLITYLIIKYSNQT